MIVQPRGSPQLRFKAKMSENDTARQYNRRSYRLCPRIANIVGFGCTEVSTVYRTNIRLNTTDTHPYCLIIMCECAQEHTLYDTRIYSMNLIILQVYQFQGYYCITNETQFQLLVDNFKMFQPSYIVI